MMTETEILDLKVDIQYRRVLVKLLEDLQKRGAAEALLIDARYSTGVSTQKVKALLEELAMLKCGAQNNEEAVPPRSALL